MERPSQNDKPPRRLSEAADYTRGPLARAYAIEIQVICRGSAARFRTISMWWPWRPMVADAEKMVRKTNDMNIPKRFRGRNIALART